MARVTAFRKLCMKYKSVPPILCFINLNENRRRESYKRIRTFKMAIFDQVLIYLVNNLGGMFAGFNNDVRKNTDVYVRLKTSVRVA